MSAKVSFKGENRAGHQGLNLIARYGSPARLLHWAVAVLVLVTWPLGLMIGFAKKDVVSTFYLLHESFGFLVLWLMLVRIGNKLTAKSPPQSLMNDIAFPLPAYPCQVFHEPPSPARELPPAHQSPPRRTLQDNATDGPTGSARSSHRQAESPPPTPGKNLRHNGEMIR